MVSSGEVADVNQLKPLQCAKGVGELRWPGPTRKCEWQCQERESGGDGASNVIDSGPSRKS